MPYNVSIELSTKTWKVTDNTGAYTYVNMYNSRLSADAVGNVVSLIDFKDNTFEFDLSLITYPVVGSVGELVDFITNYSIYTVQSNWYNGDSDPDASFGVNNDYFCNRTNGDIWIKIVGVWTLVNTSATGVNGLKSGVTAGIDTYTTTIAGVTGYNLNDTYIIQFTDANINGSTLDINGLGPIPLNKNNDVELTGGDIAAGQEFVVIYDGSEFQMIGVAPNQMFAFVSNVDSVTINKGDVVYAYGAFGDRMSVKLANNTGDPTSAKTVGIVFSSSIAVNGTGYIITQGVIQNLNTSAFTAGDTLYLSATPGQYTNVKPYAPNHLVYVGIVERANAGNGQIYVRVQNGYEMDEIHDVDLITTAPVNNDVLTYVTGSPDLWKPKSITTILGFTPENIANKSSSYTASSTTTYANTKALVDGLATKQNTLTNPVTGTGTSNEIAYFNGGGTIASLTTGTYPSLTELSYVKGVTSAIQTQINTKLTSAVYKSTTNGTASSGTTNTVSSSQLISANTFAVGEIIYLMVRAIKTGTVGSLTLRIYINTTAVISGATLVATYLSSTASNIFLQIERNLLIKSATNTQVVSTTGNLLSDVAVTSAVSTLNIDWSINQYIIFAVQNGNAGDSSVVSGYKIWEA